jgi:hypothetical protein
VRAHAAALLFAVVFAGSHVHAQVIDGRVRSAEDGAPLTGAFVRLLDPSGRQIAGVLTDARGAYALTAPVAGEYRIRIELIGREAVESGSLRLEAGQRSTWSTALSARPVEIRGLAVEGSARCEVRPAEGTLVARVWEEARKALQVASWAQRQELFRYHLVTHRRELDPDGRRIIEESTQARAGYFRSPFVSRPAAELVRDGFVQTTEDGSFAYAPDADVLLADAFLDTHCFRLEDGNDSGRIGLAFEPTRDRVNPDIRGVLRLDAETAALESVEFRYTRFPGVPASLGLGGRVEFERLPSGAWIVRRWSLEMPIQADVQRPGQPDAWDREIVGIMEEGGEVVRVLDTRGEVVLAMHSRADSLGVALSEPEVDLEAGRTSRVDIAIPTITPASQDSDLLVEGELLDDATGRPLAGALVSLVGPTGPVAGPILTDQRGNYVLEAPTAGQYRVRAETVGRTTAETGPFRIEDATRRHHSFRFGGSTVDISAGDVAASRACTLQPGPGSATGRAWAEARKALTSLVVARDSGLFAYRITVYEEERRRLGIHGAPHADTTDIRGAVAHRFDRIPIGADGLPRFVELSDTAFVALTPDPRYLISELFASRYCLRLLPGAGGPGTWAVGFEPVTSHGDRAAGADRVTDPVESERQRTDVRGLLVLDSASLALRSFHYRYVDFPYDVPDAPPGGWMTFERMPGGAFFLSDWERRLPVVARVRPETYRPGSEPRAMAAWMLHEGGRVRTAETAAGDTVWRRTAPADDGASRRMWQLGDLLDRQRGGADRGPPIASSRRRP